MDASGADKIAPRSFFNKRRFSATPQRPAIISK